ncbi:DUF4834 family protein [Albibacterium indicum]|uniref:DUF4834 family protein n=1 Tax=Albibacterium indicum TaxID=2292082 RepID=UPI000E52919F|nr:DUF4834 family protein [Pedobacter indicus]
MGFLKFLFIAILVLWVVRLVAARLLPWLLRRFATKMQEQAYREFQSQHQRQAGNPREHQRKTEGKINIEYIPPQPTNQRGSRQAGEFVDFEEMK